VKNSFLRFKPVIGKYYIFINFQTTTAGNYSDFYRLTPMRGCVTTEIY
jgi:hypothetical protein